MEEDVYDNFLMTFQKLFTKPRMYRFHYTRKKRRKAAFAAAAATQRERHCGDEKIDSMCSMS